MENVTDIWGAFFRTGSVLLFVIAIMLLFLYLLKRFSAFKLMNPEQELIKILAVHHFSPREKLVLVDVMDEKLLLGVTNQSIRTLSTIQGEKKKEPSSPTSTTSLPSTSSSLPKSFAWFLKGAGKKAQAAASSPPTDDGGADPPLVEKADVAASPLEGANPTGREQTRKSKGELHGE